MNNFWQSIRRFFSLTDELNIEIPFTFDSNPVAPEHAYWAHLTGSVSSKDELLDGLSHCLRFPAYFGFNWDALSDCLTDFSWIEERDVILFHCEMPVLAEPDLTTYLQILSDAVLDWRHLDQHCFKVVFKAQHQNQVKRLLQGYRSLGRREQTAKNPVGPQCSNSTIR